MLDINSSHFDIASAKKKLKNNEESGKITIFIKLPRKEVYAGSSPPFPKTDQKEGRKQ